MIMWSRQSDKKGTDNEVCHIIRRLFMGSDSDSHILIRRL